MFPNQVTLEEFKLGHYRTKCAEENIDIDSLGLFQDETDESLQCDLGIEQMDIAAFRAAAAKAATLCE